MSDPLSSASSFSSSPPPSLGGQSTAPLGSSLEPSKVKPSEKVPSVSKEPPSKLDNLLKGILDDLDDDYKPDVPPKTMEPGHFHPISPPLSPGKVPLSSEPSIVGQAQEKLSQAQAKYTEYLNKPIKGPDADKIMEGLDKEVTTARDELKTAMKTARRAKLGIVSSPSPSTAPVPAKPQISFAESQRNIATLRKKLDSAIESRGKASQQLGLLGQLEGQWEREEEPSHREKGFPSIKNFDKHKEGTAFWQGRLSAAESEASSIRKKLNKAEAEHEKLFGKRL